MTRLSEEGLSNLSDAMAEDEHPASRIPALPPGFLDLGSRDPLLGVECRYITHLLIGGEWHLVQWVEIGDDEGKLVDYSDDEGLRYTVRRKAIQGIGWYLFEEGER